MLHKVVGGNFKRFLYALADSNTRHNNDKLAPAVLFVQLKHRLDIHIGFTRTGFHFNIKAAPTQVFNEGSREFYVVLTLQGLNVFEKLLIGKLHQFIFISGIISRVIQLHFFVCQPQSHLHIGRLHFTEVTDIADFVVKALSGKDFNNCVNCVRLVLLYLKIKLQLGYTS